MQKTIENRGIKITLQTNDDNTVNAHVMMTVEYTLSNGKKIKKEAFPDYAEGKNYGTIDAQIDYGIAIKNFDEEVLKSGKEVKQ